jgi:CheY-like chemotaxis protein
MFSGSSGCNKWMRHMTWTVYRDVFGGWRWECHTGSTTLDSQHSYDTREQCVEAAEKVYSEVTASGPTAMTDAQNAEELSLRSQSVLCVQPKHDSHESLRRALHDHEVAIVANGFEALRLFNMSAFDAYVPAYWLPDWSGTQLCREIRKNDPHVPICFYVSATAEGPRKRALRAGANAYICASAGPGALRHQLHNLLRAVEPKNKEARAVAESIIQADLKRRRVGGGPLLEEAKSSAWNAMERAAKVKARIAFIKAGGTLAYFERCWRPMFENTAANLQKQSAEAKS